MDNHDKSVVLKPQEKSLLANMLSLFEEKVAEIEKSDGGILYFNYSKSNEEYDEYACYSWNGFDSDEHFIGMEDGRIYKLDELGL